MARRGPSHEGRLRYWDSLTLKKIGRMSREEAIDLLSWNDPNGCYRDHECGDDVEPMSTLEAHSALWRAVKESGGGRLGQVDQQPQQSAQPRRRRWLWVLAAAAAGVGGFFLVRRLVRAARRPPGIVQPAADQVDAGLPRPEKVAVLGNSLTAGYLPHLRKLLSGVEVVGEGWVGKQIATIAANGERYLDPSVTRVVIGGGVNDLASGHSAARAVRDLEALLAVARARAPQAYLYVLTVPPCPDNAACKRVAGELAKFNAAVRGLAGVYAIDMSGVGGHAKDGLHRTGQGYLQMAQAVAGVLQ